MDAQLCVDWVITHVQLGWPLTIFNFCTSSSVFRWGTPRHNATTSRSEAGYCAAQIRILQGERIIESPRETQENGRRGSTTTRGNAPALQRSSETLVQYHRSESITAYTRTEKFHLMPDTLHTQHYIHIQSISRCFFSRFLLFLQITRLKKWGDYNHFSTTQPQPRIYSRVTLFFLVAGTTAEENRGQEDPRRARGGAAEGDGQGGGPLPGADEEGSHRTGQGSAVLPDGPGQGLPRE